MIEFLAQNMTFLADQTWRNFHILEMITLILVGVHIVNVALGRRLCVLGVIPRHLLGLPGIVFAPFLHFDFNHLFFNLIPLLVLSDFILMQGLDYFLVVTVLITLISGTLVWCFAKNGIHVGASGLVTGYWALLVTNIYTQGSFLAIVLGCLSLYYFAGIFFGIFPSEKGVSWEGHLFGLVAGGLVGYFPFLSHNLMLML
ncbi:MAG: rhomboid family intramembrane serine protease [Gammaproteobacteria bacterium]|nr:rhomboid family intramembrane serine protease [Gammaproteobacteria bacterium]